MYLIVNHKNVIIEISETVETQKISGNVLINNGSLAIAKNQVKAVYEDVEVPDEVIEGKYCYTTEKGFYLNPRYNNKDAEIEALKAKLEESDNKLIETDAQITEIQLALVEQAGSEV